MSYILTKTNGTVITTVQDAATDQTTDLTFIGKNYSGYGQVQNENFLKLLENFSNATPPAKPILGQVWYNPSSNTLSVCYAEASGTVAAKFKTLATSNISSTEPAEAVIGELWYDAVNNQLKVWSGNEFILVGPATGSNIKAQWRGDFEYDAASALPVFNIKAVIGSDNEVVAIVSAEGYDLADPASIGGNSPTYPARTDIFKRIKAGITLEGADPITGSSRKEVTGLARDKYFWGTAAESLVALSALTAKSSSGISAKTTTENKQFYVPFISTGTSDAFLDEGIKYNPSTNILSTVASSALYADLAERYEADDIYEPGTVLVIGGDKEVTISTFAGDPTVAGIVSKNPAFMMNSDAGTDETHPYIALKGRVPCKVYGFISKGDLLMTSDYPGYACASITSMDSSHAIIGKALEDHLQGFGIIEVKV